MVGKPKPVAFCSRCRVKLSRDEVWRDRRGRLRCIYCGFCVRRLRGEDLDKILEERPTLIPILSRDAYPAPR